MEKQFKAAIISVVALVFGFCACKEEKQETGPETIQPATTEVKAVFVNGDSLHYIEMGNGDPVIFVHGTLDDYRLWQMQMDTFSKNHRVIAYSRRYAWPNTRELNDSADYSVSIHAKDLAEFIRAVSPKPVHLVGHSYGAFTALLATIEHPELVRTLTLGEPPVISFLQNVPGGDTILNGFVTKSLQPAAEAFRQGNNEKAISVFIAGVTGDTSFYSKLPVAEQKKIVENILELRGVALKDNNLPPVTCEDLKKIKAPVLVMTGQNSPPFFSVTNREISKCLPNKENVTLANASHGLEMENPADFNRIVLGFIDKH